MATAPDMPCWRDRTSLMASRSWTFRVCGVAQQGVAVARQVDAARLAPEELHAQLVLQRANALGQRRLGHAKFGGRRRQAARLGDGEEIFELPQAHDTSNLRRTYRLPARHAADGVTWTPALDMKTGYRSVRLLLFVVMALRWHHSPSANRQGREEDDRQTEPYASQCTGRHGRRGAGGKVPYTWAAAAAPITIVINQSPWFDSFRRRSKLYEKETGNKVNLDVNPFAGSLREAAQLGARQPRATTTS